MTMTIKEKHPRLMFAYEIMIALLALLSVVLVILDLRGRISLLEPPFRTIDWTLLSIFWADYIVRLRLSRDKKAFVKQNKLNLIAMIPFNSIFSVFRLARLTQLAKLARISRLLPATRLVRLVGFVTILKRKRDRFLNTNGFVYIFYLGCVLIIGSALILSQLEQQPFLDMLWFSIVTCTTVGYGDISPVTGAGRVLSVILMIFGIGFIGMLTGTITTYFSRSVKADDPGQEIDPELLDVLPTLSPEQQVNLIHLAKAMQRGGLSVTINPDVT